MFGEVPSSWRVFVTCLRSLAISFEETELPGVTAEDQIFRGESAYRFLLEVACGLKSPIIGETEVFGQFRHFADAWKEKAAFFQNLYADVKSIRQVHLSHLGSQSYGSWVRKRLKSHETVHILGTGQLAQEILIWLKKQNAKITLHSRTPQMAKERLHKALGDAMDGVEVADFKNRTNLKKSVLIVASPLKAREIAFWLDGQKPSLVIDLRDDSSTDSLIVPKSVRLSDIFGEIESSRRQATDKVQKARAMVTDLAAKRFRSQTNRPFGWDDLCA